MQKTDYFIKSQLHYERPQARVVSLFQLYTNTRQQANKLQSIKKNSSWRTLLSLDDTRNDFRGEVSLASICKFKKRDLLFFFQQIPGTEYTLEVQLKL